MHVTSRTIHLNVRKGRGNAHSAPSNGEEPTNKRRGRRGETIVIRFPCFTEPDGGVRVGIIDNHANGVRRTAETRYSPLSDALRDL